MKRFAWAVLGLGLWAVASVAPLRGQAPPGTVELKQSHPNPSDPGATIPFTLSGDLFTNGHRPIVSLKVYNVLAQVVATPVLVGTGEVLDNLLLSCEDLVGCSYTAYWDGSIARRGLASGHASPGVYLYQLVVDGARFTKKMVVVR